MPLTSGYPRIDWKEASKQSTRHVPLLHIAIITTKSIAPPTISEANNQKKITKFLRNEPNTTRIPQELNWSRNQRPTTIPGTLFSNHIG